VKTDAGKHTVGERAVHIHTDDDRVHSFSVRRITREVLCSQPTTCDDSV